MITTKLELSSVCSASGFEEEPFEKADRLLDLLREIAVHPYLRNRLILKGGTALNLFVMDVPRLSVDIDLNYIGSADRTVMEAERPEISRALESVLRKLDLKIKRTPTEHAGGKYRLSYDSLVSSTGSLECDINYTARVPLWAPIKMDSKKIESLPVVAFPVCDKHELAAGKFAALFSRSKSRDVFDARELIRRESFEYDRLRLAFMVYGGMSRRDWRECKPEDIVMDPVEASRNLVRVLRRSDRPAGDSFQEWCRTMQNECRQSLSFLFPFKPEESEFLDRLNGAGEIIPDLLTDDPVMAEKIRIQPGLLWKAQNVRQFRNKPKG